MLSGFSYSSRLSWGHAQAGSITRIPWSLFILKEPVQRRPSVLVVLGLFLVTLLVPGIVQSGPHFAVLSFFVVVP